MKVHTHAAIVLRKIAGRVVALFNSEHFGMAVAGPRGGFALSPAFVGGLGLILAVTVVALATLAFTMFGPGVTGAALLATAPLAATQADVQAVADKLGSAFEQFKAANDERLKAGDRADALLNAHVDRINADITKLQAELSETIKAAARPNFNAPQSKEEQAKLAHVREFLALTRGITDRHEMQALAVTNEDLEQVQQYGRSLNAYLRTGKANAAMQTGSQPDGGYLITPDKSGRLVQLVYEQSPIRQLASIQVVGTDALEGVLDLEEGDAGWVGETETRGDSNTPKLGEWRIPVQEVYAMPKTTQRSLDDASRDLEGWLVEKAAARMARMEGAASVSGDGNKKWMGILPYASASKPTSSNWKRIEFIKTGTSGGFGTTGAADKIIDAIQALKTIYRPGAVFFGNSLTIAAVRKIKNGNGEYVFQPDMVNGFNGRLCGYPLVDFADMPDPAADSLSLGFGNLREGYQIVDRLGIRVLRDPLTTKGYVKFYVTKRSGGDVVNFEAIKLLKFGT
ncbi:MAG: phage major capsid protein [Gemmatimonas sp.]|nr:phage major capsid protein [Gemmatimonas sp.]